MGSSNVDLVQQIKDDFAATKVHVKWWGVEKSLDETQRKDVAEKTGVDPAFIKATRKLIDTRHEAYRACTSVKSRAKQLWRDNTLAHPETGVRMLRQTNLTVFGDKFIGFKAELDQAVAHLSEVFSDLTVNAREKCRYNRYSDYPQTIADMFDISWTIVNIEPPEYLKVSHAKLYEREKQRVEGLLQQVVVNAEHALATEFQSLLSHLVTQLGMDKDTGKSKRFHPSQIENLRSFFDKFSDLNVTGNDHLEGLIHQSQQILSGVDVSLVGDSDQLRGLIKGAMGKISDSLDDMMVNRPKRAIRFVDD